jgi:uncharacterized membrane protein
MSIDLGVPAALWLLVLLPVVWLTAWRGRSPLRRRAAPAVVRSAVVACLAGALAEPVLSRPVSRVALIALVDASHSVSSGALAAAADTIDALAAEVRPDALRLLAFGGRTAPLPGVAALRNGATPAGRDALDTLVAAEATNLEQALAAARAEAPAGANTRLVLFSDGHATDGDTRRVVERLAADHITVFTRPLAVRDLGDTWIEAVRAPRGAVAGGVTTLDVILGSQAVRRVAIEVRESTRVLARTTVDASLGVSIAPVEVRFADPGPHLVEAIITSADRPDPLDANNTLSVEIVVEPRPRVLFAHGQGDVVPVAARVLAEAGVEVTGARPEELPADAAAFDRWNAVVLSDLARARVADAAMAALAAWVEERGGGLLFIGGPAVDGDPLDESRRDFRGTELERVLPVTFDREDEAEVALVIVLDRSWSMNGAAMDLSKIAAEAAANTLSPAHLVGVLSFSSQATWDVPLSRLRDSRATLPDAIARIRASGPTDIYLALTQAADVLTVARARARHLILLSDGQTEPADFEGLVRRLTGARVTVSSVALGSEADVRLLQNIAAWGGGRSYVVQDAREVPAIFVKEARTAANDEEGGGDGIRPRLGTGAVLRDLGEFPVLQAFNPVRGKADAITLLATARGEPLLALWPAGLGRTAMFAADLDGRWTSAWTGWRGYGAFLGTLVRLLAPRRLPARVLAVEPGERQGALRVLRIGLDARDADRHPENLLRPAVHVRGAHLPADGSVDLLQTAPGRYEARIVADVSQPLTLALTGDPAAGDAARRLVVADHAAEYRFGEPDERALAEIARATGGVVHATADDLQRAPRTAVALRHALAPWLLLLALVGWLADIAVRRRATTAGGGLQPAAHPRG